LLGADWASRTLALRATVTRYLRHDIVPTLEKLAPVHTLPHARAPTLTKRFQWPLAGLAIGAMFLWLALRGTDLAGVWAVLRTSSPGWAAAAFAGGLFFVAAKAARWSLLLRPMARPPYALLQRITYVGGAANLVVSHSGELLRASALARKTGLTASAVLATIALERMFDFVALLTVIGLALVLDPHVSRILANAGLLALGIVAAAFALAVAVLWPTPRSARLGAALLGMLPSAMRGWVAEHFRRAIDGLASLRQPATILGVLALSMLQWSGIVVAIWASAAAVGAFVPLTGTLAVFVLSVIGLTMPSSPAALGSTQLAYTMGLGFVGVGAKPAFAASLIYTGLIALPIMAIGAALWLRGER